MRLATNASYLALTFVAGCLEPLVSDEPGASTHILPPGSAVAHISEDADLTRQIRVNDQLSDSALEDSGGVLALKSGFADGVAVKYWDFGNVPDAGGLMFRLMQRGADGTTLTPVDHPYIVNALPGDPFYSPIWMLQDVVVTERYHGEVLPSLDAITDAVDLGLVEEPVPALLLMDGPIVPKGTVLDRGEGQPTQGTIEVFARGYRVDLFAIGANPLKEQARAGRINKGDVHMLTVENSATAMRSPLFQNLGDPWTPVVRVINCRITAADPADPTTTVVDEDQLFVRDPMGALKEATDRVISWQTTTGLKNWPILVTTGTP